MRTLKLALAAVAAFALDANAQVTGLPTGYQAPVVGASPTNTIAFHAGGVAACDGCHVMHNASPGPGVKSTTGGTGSVAPWTNVTNMYLLQGSDQSSTCLMCHGAAGASGQQFTINDTSTTLTVPANKTPAGDFAWVRLDFGTSVGQRHGHNIAAGDLGFVADPDYATAPGGSYQVGSGRAQFGCISCHDPHGRYRMQLDATKPNGVTFAGPFPTSPDPLPIAASGSYGDEPTATYAVGAYRLLGGQYYAPASNTSSPFPNDPPVAVAPTQYNRGEATSETRVAYGTGMSEWCQNCHTNVHLDAYNSGVAGLRHPAGSDATLHAGQYLVYNKYVSSGVMDPAATSKYTSLVPFEQGKDATLATLRGKATSSSIIAADAKSNVMCLSCHRAHASAFDSMVRWDQNSTFLTNGTDYAQGSATRTPAQTSAGYYDRTVGSGAGQIGPYQRSLCNKCHGKD